MPTVLIADDNSNIQKMATLALKDQGFDVVGVSNGEAAVRKLAEINPDVVLADVFMPVRTGYEVCEYIKNNAQFAHVPVVLLVGAFDPIDEHEVKRVRPDDVLQKPFVPPDPLIAMVRQMAEKSAAARRLSAAAPSPVESTLKLSQEELKALLEQQRAAEAAAAAPVPEPEPELPAFGARPEPIAISESDQQAAFGALLESPAEETAELDVETPKKPPAREAFVASALEGVEIAEETEPQPLPEGAAPPAAGAELAAEAAPEPVEEAPPETPVWGGIESPPREPSPDEPPIPVEFGPAEPLELVTDEDAASARPSLEIAAPAELASSPDDFMAAAAQPPAELPLPAAPPPPAPVELLAEEKAPVPTAQPERDEFSLAKTQEVPILTVRPPVLEPPPPPAPVVAEPASPAAPPPDPALVAAVVEQVLSRVQAEIARRFSGEALRPLVEDLLRERQDK